MYVTIGWGLHLHSYFCSGIAGASPSRRSLPSFSSSDILKPKERNNYISYININNSTSTASYGVVHLQLLCVMFHPKKFANILWISLLMEYTENTPIAQNNISISIRRHLLS